MNLAFQSILLDSLTPTEKGNKFFGENFTQSILIDEILDQFPPSVFSNPELRWLDPCTGLGNFSTKIFARLFEGLAQAFPNHSERKKHIISNMIFMVEIQESSAAYARKMFGRSTNIHIGNFLSDDLPKKWPSQFDIVIGNPPYERIVAGSRSAKNDNLWSKFIDRGFDLLAKDGYLSLITPPAWMSPTSKQLNRIFLRNSLLYLDIQACARHFDVGSKFCYFLLQKSPRNDQQKVRVNVDFKGSKSLVPSRYAGSIKLPAAASFIPQLCTPAALSILKKTAFSEREKFAVMYDSDLHRYTKRSLLSSRKSKNFSYRTVHTPKQTFWAKRPHKNFGKVKVFLPLTTNYEELFIDDCGNTQGVGYILCNSVQEANKVARVLLSRPYRFIAGITRWSNFNVPGVMKSLPFVDTSLTPLSEITDDWIGEQLGLDSLERDYIESLIR